MAMFMQIKRHVMTLDLALRNPTEDLFINLDAIFSMRKDTFEGLPIISMISGGTRQSVAFINEQERNDHFDFIIMKLDINSKLCGLTRSE